MQQKDLDKIDQILIDEFQNNDKNMDINYEKEKMSKVNQFSHKIIETISYSMLPYFVFIITILSHNSILAQTSFPVECLSLLIASSSLVLGTIGKKIIDWKLKIKKRFNSFSHFNSDTYKLQEEMKYAATYEQEKNKNEVIVQSMQLLRINHSIANEFDNCSDVRIDDTEMIKKQIDKLSNNLEKKYDNLYTLSLKKILHDKFIDVRMKNHKLINILLTIIGGICTLLYFNLPLFILNSFQLNIYSLISLATSLIGGTAFFGIYTAKKDKTYKNAFNNLNRKLGEEALPITIHNYSKEKKEINMQLRQLINEISEVYIQLQEQKMILNNCHEKEKQYQMSLSLSPLNKTEKQENNEALFINSENGNNLNTSLYLTEDSKEGPTLVYRKK